MRFTRKMNDELFDRGYQIIRELDRHPNSFLPGDAQKPENSSRVTYEAIALERNQQVTIKEFRFANSDANWASFEAYEREIEILKPLQHPRIPAYLDSIETSEGFCLVTEYKKAHSLAQKSRYTPEQIKKIAISVLEILVYLQKQKPPIVHGDIKPENILVDDRLNAYLINFGSAQKCDRDTFNNSLAGTVGFMPPEQELNGTITIASDLYSLGVTLICLLTGTDSANISKLSDRRHRFGVKKLMPQLSALFIIWLEKMVAPKVTDRFESASAALEALKPIPVFGDAADLGNVAKAIAPFKVATLLAIASITMITMLSTNLIIWRQQRRVSHYHKGVVISPPRQQETLIWKVLATKECQQCYLRQAEMPGRNLKGAKLQGADLVGANLKGAKLDSARLQGAILDSAELQGATMVKVRLRGATLANATLDGAKLTNAELNGTNLVNASLRGVNFKNAQLRSANFQAANLMGANLQNAKLQGANLQNANLKNANFRGANLEGVNFDGANLEGAIGLPRIIGR